MKIWYVLLLICFTYSCKGSHPRKGDDSLFNRPKILSGELKFDKSTIDFGNVNKDTLLSGKFLFTNTGKDSLIINGISPDCSCTSTKLSKSVILPGDTASIVINVSTHEKDGKNRLYSTIVANTKTKMYLLTVIFNVE